MDKNEDNLIADLPITPRRGLVVWVYNLRQLKNLKRYGTIIHASRKMKYVILYVNEGELGEIQEKIEKLHFVRSVEQSYRPDISVTTDLSAILADMVETEEDFTYNGVPVTPLIMNK